MREWLEPWHTLTEVVLYETNVLRETAGPRQRVYPVAEIVRHGLAIRHSDSTAPARSYTLPIRTAGLRYTVGAPGEPITTDLLDFLERLLPQLQPWTLQDGSLHLLGDLSQSLIEPVSQLAQAYGLELTGA